MRHDAGEMLLQRLQLSNCREVRKRSAMTSINIELVVNGGGCLVDFVPKTKSAW